MKDYSKLQVFSRGFLQDVLTFMKMMDMEGITREDVKRYIKKDKGKELKKSGKRKQFGKPVGNPKPFSEKKNLGCKGCEEKRLNFQKLIDEQNLKEE